MDISQVVEAPKYIVIGIIWMLVHVALLFAVGKMIKAPIFYLAVGSKANIGGAASARPRRGWPRAPPRRAGRP